MKKEINKYLFYIILFLTNPIYILSLFIVLIFRILSPFFLIRIGFLRAERIGHFAAETELYLLEQREGINKPKIKFIDFFYLSEINLVNSQLLKIWKKKIIILPKFLLHPIDRINNFLPLGENNKIGRNSNFDRDVNNLLDKYPSNIQLTEEEISTGNKELKKFGILPNDKIICLIVRNDRYLKKLNPSIDFSYHDYRNCDINNFLLAAEELTKRGYYILRMGSSSNNPLSNNNNEKIIDYSISSIRSDFMDIFLGYRCSWCITTSTGWDAVPMVLFRKPAVVTNYAPVSYAPTFLSKIIFIPKKYYYEKEKRLLKHSEIYKMKINFSLRKHEFEEKNIKLIENTPEEIFDVCVEMDDRLKNKYLERDIYNQHQKKYWSIFNCDDLNGWQMHGKLKAKIGSKYLHDNPYELQ